MASIESRVVELKFNGSHFMDGARKAKTALDDLKSRLDFKGVGSGIQSLGSKLSGLSVRSLSDSAKDAASQFSVMGAAAAVALGNIATQAIQTGAQLLKSLTIQPLLDGLGEYETQIGAVQTILANTQSKGTTIDQVNAALDNLNTYADKTIYNFSEMTRNIGLFTAAGVDLDTSVSAIKGISNLAALSGSSSQQASVAMTQLSQAIASGTVKLQDWNSVQNAGMGGEAFKNLLIEVARTHGAAVDDYIAKEGSFRESLKHGWLEAGYLTEALTILTGDLNEEQLISMGYTAEQAAQMTQLAQSALDSATKVKTFTQLIDTLKESLGSGWAQTWEIIFGNFEEASALFTELYEMLDPIIQKSSESRNALLQGWKDLGGREAIIQSVRNAFQALQSILAPIGQAFREIFPPVTAKNLYDISVAIQRFTEKLIIGSSTAEKVKRVFKGIFAVLDILRLGIVAIAGVFGGLFSKMAGGSGTILGAAANFGDWLVKLRDGIRDGEKFQKVLEPIKRGLTRLGQAFSTVGKWIKDFVNQIKEIFNFGEKVDTSGLAAVGERVEERMEPVKRTGNWVKTALEKIINAWKWFKAQLDKVHEPIQKIVDKIADIFGGTDLNTILDLVNGLLTTGILLTIKKFVSGLSLFGKDAEDSAGGIVDAIKEAFGGLTDTLSAMQNTLKAHTIVAIAAAVGILTASVIALSGIDSGKLTKALLALSVMFTQIFGFMTIFDKVLNGAKFTGIFRVAGAMILLAAAIRILVPAVEDLSKLDWKSLIKGLAGVSAIMVVMAGSAKIMDGVRGAFIRIGIALILMSVAVRLLVGAVRELGDIDMGSLAKGLLGVSVLLAGLAAFMKIGDFSKGGLAAAAGILIMSFAIRMLAKVVEDLGALDAGTLGKGLAAVGAIIGGFIALDKLTSRSGGMILMAAGLLIVSEAVKRLAEVVKELGSMDVKTLAKGLISMGVAVGSIALALSLMPATSIINAASIIIVAFAIKELSKSIKLLGSMKLGDLAKGLGAMAAALVIVGLAISFMPWTAIAGAGALIVAAYAMKILGDVVKDLGSLKWDEVGRGLLALGGSLAILSVALIAMSGAVSGALALIVAAGALRILADVLKILGGMSLQEIGLALLAMAGTFTVLGIAALALTPVIPGLFLLGAAIGLIGAGTALAGAGVLALATGLAILGTVGAGALVVFGAALDVVLQKIPEFGTKAAEAVINFAEKIVEGTPTIEQALISMGQTIINVINTLSPQIIDTVWDLVTKMVNKFVDNVPLFVDAGWKILIGFLKGIRDNIYDVVTIATDIIVRFLQGIQDNMPRITNKGADLIIAFVNSMANTIRQKTGELRSAGINLATAIIDGMTGGLASQAWKVGSKIRSLANNAITSAKNALGIKSPSRVFRKIGVHVGEGFVLGMGDMYGKVGDASEEMGKNSIKAMNDALQEASNSLEVSTDTTIRPVVDLSEVDSAVSQINNKFGQTPLNFTATAQAAQSVQNSAQPVAPADPNTYIQQPAPTYNYTQNNYSPEPLSALDIYNRTSSMLARMEERAR